MVASVPGVHQAHHFDGRHGVANGVRQIDLRLRGRAETGASLQRAFERGQDFGMPVTEQQRSPGAHVVDVFVAIGIEDVAALAARDEQRLAAHAAEGAHRRIDAAGNLLHRTTEQGFGS
jgi:hypothetical protein